jgi:hypothetical integral membrane protein (TIGR02206 family)
MESSLKLLGPDHILIVASIPLAAGLLAAWSRRHPASARSIRLGLGFLLLGNEVVWYTYASYNGLLQFPEGLPLQLSDLALWLTLISAFTIQQGIFEVAYFAALAGSSMAILTPDLWAPLLSYPTIYFFLEHGLVVCTVLYLIWSGQARPRASRFWRIFGILNLWALGVGIFDGIFNTNFMYLCRKPASPSLLNYLGPWPVYLLASEGLALIFLGLLLLPFRKTPSLPPAKKQ